MHTPDIFDMIRDMLRLFHVRLHLFKAPYENLPEIDFHMREHLFHNYNYLTLLHALRTPLQPGYAYSSVDAFGSHYVAFSLETDGTPPPYEFAVIGPYNYCAVTQKDIEMLIAKFNIPKTFQQDLLVGLGHVPTIQQRELWLNMQIFLISRLIGKNGQIEFRTYNDFPTETADFTTAIYNSDNTEHYRSKTLSGGYGIEEQLLNAVKKGNVDQAIRLTQQYINFQINYHHSFRLSPQYAVVELNALLRRVALEEGIHILRLDEIYVKYRRLSEQPKLSAMHATYTDMVTDYCKLITKYARQNYSMAVWRSLDYIDFNYQQNISLHRLATMFNVSAGYLSTCFKKEIGWQRQGRREVSCTAIRCSGGGICSLSESPSGGRGGLHEQPQEPSRRAARTHPRDDGGGTDQPRDSLSDVPARHRGEE